MAGLYLSCTRHWRSAMLPWFSPTCCYPQSTLPWSLSPGTHLSHSHLKHVSTHFQLPSRGKKKQPNRLLSKSHETHCDLLMTESAATPRTHLTQAQKTKNNKQKKKKRTLQSRSCSAATIIQQPLQEEAHIMIPLVCLHGCIIHWMNSLFLIH